MLLSCVVWHRLDPCMAGWDGSEGVLMVTAGNRGLCAGGQAKRVNIGIALVGSNPRVLFLDEPTSGLDSYTSNEVPPLTSRTTYVTCGSCYAGLQCLQRHEIIPSCQPPLMDNHIY